MMASAKQASLEKKVRVVKRVMFWTTLVNILIFIAVIVLAYSLLK
jgi:hypothetical protein